MGADPVTIAVAASLVAGAASAGASAYGAHQERKEAKKQRRLQEGAIADEKAKALEERKTLIDRQREKMSATGTGTRGFSSSGIKANIDKLG